MWLPAVVHIVRLVTFGNKEVLVCMSNTSLKWIFTKFACTVREMLVCCTGAYCHKKARSMMITLHSEM